MGVDEKLAHAFERLQGGQTDAAEAAFREVLASAPGHPAALHFLGLCAHMRGDAKAAVELIEEACEAAPDYLDAFNNLGNIQLELGNTARAETCFRRVISIEPRFAATHFNLGMMLLREGRLDDAVVSLDAAARLEPNEATVHARLGDACAKNGEFLRAREAYRRALELDPTLEHERKKLGKVYFQILDGIDRSVGDPADAIRYLDEWLVLEPDNAIALHSRAAYAGEGAPARASDAYVKATYDQFAESFDFVLGHLGYQGHAICAEALETALFDGEPEEGAYAVLDAGCGTGALGPLIAPWAGRITGVDLSGQMLERAKARKVYDELIEAELGAYLADCEARFDAVVCADALIYFGDLDELFRRVAQALAPEGVFVFTVELAAGDGYSLLRNGRYAHSRAYLAAVIERAGMSLEAEAPIANLRVEFGKEVPGLL
ncbi:MAG: tetratricopeptide repeat protein, partial [Myxococcales bacterium]|nr:tetratricopeptide repeat protein [Myxococcales bacterium]